MHIYIYSCMSFSVRVACVRILSHLFKHANTMRGASRMQISTGTIPVENVRAASIQKDTVTSEFIKSKGAFKNCLT